jgi:hypothetical protein
MVILFSCKKDESSLLEPSDTFVKYFGGTYDNDASQMIQTSDGGFILAGKTEGGSGLSTMFVVKISSEGNEEWSKSYSNSNEEEATSIISGINGGYVIASNQTDINGNQTVFLTKIGSTGSVSWRQSYFQNDSTSVEKVIATSSNEYVMIGNATKYDATNLNPSGKSDFVLIKVNSDGDLINSSQWGGIDDDFAYDIIESPSVNSFVVVGSTNSFQPPPLAQTSVQIAEFGYPLNLKSRSNYGGASDDIAKDIELLSDGYIICGESESNGNGGKDVYLLKTSFDIFNVIFEKYLGGSGDDIGNSLTKTSNGDFLIGGSTSSFGNGNDATNDGFLIKTNGSGNELFTQTFGHTGDENITDVLSLEDGKIALLGVSEVGGNTLITLTKTKEDGTLN